MKTYLEKNKESIEALRKKISALFPEVSPKVYVETYGCQQNEADSEKLFGMSLDVGYVKTDNKNEADLILVNTCAVREHAELKALSNTGQLKHIKEKNPNLIIGVCGCMVQQEHRMGDIKNKYPYVDFVFGTNKIFDFPSILLEVINSDKRKFFLESFETNRGDFCEEVPVARSFPNKAWVSIMYGCNNFCSYCVVPYVRGRERSRSPEAIISEINELLASGCRDITLLGQNVNSYGKDLVPSLSFVELLEKIEELPEDFVLRFMTSHPKDATHELFDFIAKSRKLEHHFHLPLQSGSDRILKEMNRNYTREGFLNLCKYAKSVIPDISFTTDIIVGFPGETEEDFLDTLSALSEVKFDGVFSFVYSKRVGTRAAQMQNQIDEETKKERMSRLLELQQSILFENNSKLNGNVFEVMVEGVSKHDDSVWAGRTRDGKLIHFPKENTPEFSLGDKTYVQVTDAQAYTVLGKYINSEEK